MKVTYQGQWEFPDKTIRIFNLHLPDGRCPTFSVAPGECLKEKMAETQRRFAKERAA